MIKGSHGSEQREASEAGLHSIDREHEDTPKVWDPEVDHLMMLPKLTSSDKQFGIDEVRASKVDDSDLWPPIEHFNRQQIMCTLYDLPFELDNKQVLHAHLSAHFRQLYETHLCDICRVGFVHNKDLAEHLRCACKGVCGFSFPHRISCTGHHPPVGISSMNHVLLRFDRKSFFFHLRNWEHRWLRLYIGSIAILAESQRLRPVSYVTQTSRQSVPVGNPPRGQSMASYMPRKLVQLSDRPATDLSRLLTKQMGQLSVTTS